LAFRVKKNPAPLPGGVLGFGFVVALNRDDLSRTDWRGNKKYEYYKDRPERQTQLNRARLREAASNYPVVAVRAIHGAEQNTAQIRVSTIQTSQVVIVSMATNTADRRLKRMSGLPLSPVGHDLGRAGLESQGLHGLDR
jgi:hypothetical protein